MTGFGKGSAKSPYGTITAEIKTLNYKHLSVSCAPFEGFFLLEERFKDIFGKEIIRGKVLVKISRESKGSKKSLQKVQIDKNVAGEYAKKVREIQKGLSLKGEVRIQDLLGFPGVVEQSGGEKERKIWPYVKKATEEALRKVIKYREKEGAELAQDFADRLRRIRKALKDIRKYEKQSIERYRNRLAEMIRIATKKSEVDKGRLEEEVALFARNCDIAEELVRLENHAEAYGVTLKTEKADIGKKLDFIAQEMYREANTIGAKGNDYRISNAVIEIKSEIEKIREQLKNIE